MSQETELDKDNQHNPFSFKSFMKRASESDVSQAGTSKKKGGKKPPGQSKKDSKKEKKKSGSVLIEEEPALELTNPGNASKGGPVSEEENPFSFAKFVKRKESAQTTVFSQRTKDSSDSDSDAPKAGIHNPPLYTQGSKTSPRTKPSLITVSEKENIFDDSDFSSEDEAPVIVPGVSVVDDPLGLTAIPDVGPSLTLASETNDVDDFSNSSGSPDALGGRGEDIFADVAGLGSADSSLIKKLKAENERLRKELLHSKQETIEEKEKNADLKKKLKLLQKKEKEEAKALEEMVQKVEANLVTSTKRALSAEATIEKLKKEIQTLNVKLKQSNLQSVHQQYEEILRGVREKANYASQQLVSASHKADQSIKELVSGVDTLKSVAEVLQFIDNVTELRQDTAS